MSLHRTDDAGSESVTKLPRAARIHTDRPSKIRAEYLVNAVRKALENMDRKYCKLSHLDYKDTYFPKVLSKTKYLERPFAYEFYHQLRRLIETKRVNFGGALVQAEVDKRYQHMPHVDDIPDFIIHLPGSPKNNIAVIEFKLASRNVNDITDDFKKLLRFQGPLLKYDQIIEALIGRKTELSLRRDCLRSRIKSLNAPIKIVEFDVDSWKAHAT